MNKLIMVTVLAVLASFVCCPICTYAKARPKLTKKPAGKTAHYVKGTKQFSGENAQFGTTYTLGKSDPFNITIKSAEYSDAVKIGGSGISNGERFLIANFTLKNASPIRESFRWDTFDRKLIDTDGIATGNCKDVFRASKDDSFSSNLEPGQELTLRYAFSVPKDTSLKTFSVKKQDGRTYELDISKVQ